MRTRIKVCGFTNADDLQAALDLGIDAVGLNLAKGPRKISLDQAIALRQLIPPGVSTVGLFVDADLATMRRAIDEAQLDWIQLHGNEQPDVAKELMPHCRVLRACRVQDRNSLEAAASYPCHALLLDAYVPGIEGGSGHGWNHAILENWTPPSSLDVSWWHQASHRYLDTQLTPYRGPVGHRLRQWCRIITWPQGPCFDCRDD